MGRYRKAIPGNTERATVAVNGSEISWLQPLLAAATVLTPKFKRRKDSYMYVAHVQSGFLMFTPLHMPSGSYTPELSSVSSVYAYGQLAYAGSLN